MKIIKLTSSRLLDFVYGVISYSAWAALNVTLFVGRKAGFIKYGIIFKVPVKKGL